MGADAGRVTTDLAPRNGNRQPLSPVPKTCHVLFLGAVGATEDGSARFDAVAEDGAPTVLAAGRERMRSALETVEHVGFTADPHLECFVVVVTADLAGRHGPP